MVSLPNKITLLRTAAIPVFIIFLSIDIPYKSLITALIFTFIASLDSLDGYIARKKQQKTTVGAFIDPLADKLLISAALIFLIGRGVAPWMAYTIIAREFAVTGLRLLAVNKNVVIKASNLGKLKTISQVVAVIAVLINFIYAWHLMLIAVIFTLISGIHYFIAGRSLLKE